MKTWLRFNTIYSAHVVILCVCRYIVSLFTFLFDLVLVDTCLRQRLIRNYICLARIWSKGKFLNSVKFRYEVVN